MKHLTNIQPGSVFGEQIKIAIRQVSSCPRRIQKAEQDWHVTRWRRSIFDQSVENCRRYGDFRKWHERYDVDTQDLPYDCEDPVWNGPWRSDAKWFSFGRFIINEDLRLKKDGTTAKADRAEQISDALNRRFGDKIRKRGHDPAQFQRKNLDRVWDRHEAGELDG